jgi:hypothetical protein
MCDCLVLWSCAGTARAGAIELKGGGLNAVDCAKQLAGGARLLEELAPDATAASFFPVLAHRGIASIEVSRLRRLRVRFRNVAVPITLARCGTPFADVVAPAAVGARRRQRRR